MSYPQHRKSRGPLMPHEKRDAFASKRIRFFRHVTPLSDDECWLWRGTLSGVGYGQIRIFKKCYYATIKKQRSKNA